MTGKRQDITQKRKDKLPGRTRDSKPESGQAAESGKKGRPGRDKQKIRRRIILALAVILAVVLGLALAINLFIQKPEVPEVPEVQNEEGDTEVAPSYASTTGRKTDFFTFLIIGRDTGGGGNTDTILLASYDVPNQKLNVMSIPRDTMVNVSWDVKKINSVYNNYGKGDKGIEALDEEIAQLVGFEPDFQVVVEWKAVGELVDALGGVYYDVPRNMYYVDPTQDLVIDVKKGYQLLDGDKAMQVVRFREGANGYANGDLGRIETQQGFLKAVVEQCLKVQNMTRVGELAKVFKDNVTTNLTINNLAWFAQQAIFGGLSIDDVNFVTMPCTSASAWSRSYGQKLSYVVADVDELVELVNECFNPFNEALERNELDIMYVNSDGTLASSSGKLEDTKANPSYLAAMAAKSSSSDTEDDSETTQEETPNDDTETIEEETPETDPDTGEQTEELPEQEPDTEEETGDSEPASDSGSQTDTQTPDGEGTSTETTAAEGESTQAET